MKRHALILAGGEGRRAGGDLPKQFVELLGIPILWWSVIAFHEENPETTISIVMHPGFFDDWDIMVGELPEAVRDIPVRLVAGGRSRGESVRNGLMNLGAAGDDLVAVHDAARPLLTPAMISRGWDAAIRNGNAVPAVPVTNSLRKISGEDSEAVDRSEYVAVQTPQIFRYGTLKKAYALPEEKSFTDDASRVQALGERIFLYKGEPSNIKVTNPDDFAIARVLLERRR